MRPIKLTAEGFSAFRDPIEIDFDEVDFFALVGPTGSGKSSVIDAMCFALYGCVPRYENKTVVAPAITIGALQAKVSLEFSVGEERYIATRVVRRQPRGGATTKEARLEHLTAQPAAILAGNADEVSARVEELLGLSFDYFTRCVVLPQGEFARFLHDKPSERQQLLRSLLNLDIYARMGQRARELATSTCNSVVLLGQQLAGLEHATAANLEAAEARVGSLEQLMIELRQASGRLSSLQAEIDEQQRAVVAHRRLSELLGTIAVPVSIDVAAGEQRQLVEAVELAAEELRSAASERRELESAGGGLPPRGPLEQAAAALAALAQVQNGLPAAAGAVTKAKAELTTCEVVRADTDRAADEAEGALEEARRQHAAAHLAETLAEGEPCPVCLQVVTSVPRHKTGALIEGAETAYRQAVAARLAAVNAVTKAASTLGSAESRHQSLLEEQARHLGAVEGHGDAADVARALEALDDHEKNLAASRRLEDQARDLHQKCVEAAEEAGREMLSAWKSFDAQRDPVAELGPPSPGRVDVSADWKALAAWGRKELASQKAAAATAARAAESLSSSHEAELSTLAGSCLAAGVELDGATSITDLREAAASSLESARGQARAISADIERAGEIAAEAGALAEEADVAELLASHLRSTGFERWLVAEALGLLVIGASDTLRRLSGGQYSLTHDDRNDFAVIDHRNADEQRAARTLSGGETFQASLALALALADQLAGMTTTGSARIESIFLDEGFGTLDPDALSTVADTVEALGSDERMVGIVTHVRELAERVPVRYEVTKDARTSTVTKRRW